MMWQLKFVLMIVFVTLQAQAQVSSPPRITKQPPTDEIFYEAKYSYDHPLVIECEAEGEPAPKYRWIKNGKRFDWQIYDDRMTQQPGRGTLVITSSNDEDEGQYQCFAENEHGIATSNSVFVRKIKLNKFNDENPKTVNANEGEPFKLECQSPDGWPKPMVYWLIQYEDGTIESINNTRTTLGPDGNLYFSNITHYDASDGSHYFCAAKQAHRSTYEAGNRIILKVVRANQPRHPYPLTLQYVTRNNEVALRGKPIELFCIYGGTPLPQTHWTKNGSPIQWDDRITPRNYGKSLIIPNATLEDQGLYTCEVSNGIDTAHYSIFLNVTSVPYFTVEPEIQIAVEDETVEFRCEASGIPEPTIEWIHNGKPISEAPSNPRQIISTNRIVIQKLKLSDTGNYGCNASNAYGYVYKDVYLTTLPKELTGMTTSNAQNIPNAPRLIGLNCTPHHAIITWEPSDDNRESILHYIIQYNTSFAPYLWEDAIDEVPSTEFVANVKLSPWTNYTFRVIAYNKAGRSLPSEHSELCETPPDVPYKNPDGVKGEAPTPSELVVSWKPMPEIEHNGPRFHYRIYYKLDGPGEDWGMYDILDWKQEHFAFLNLRTFTRYHIKVVAINEFGESKAPANQVIGYFGKDRPQTVEKISDGNRMEVSLPAPKEEPIYQSIKTLTKNLKEAVANTLLIAEKLQNEVDRLEAESGSRSNAGTQI